MVIWVWYEIINIISRNLSFDQYQMFVYDQKEKKRLHFIIEQNIFANIQRGIDSRSQNLTSELDVYGQSPHWKKWENIMAINA